MNVLVLLLVALVLLGLASRYYGGWISRKLGVDPGNPTPAHTVNDGRDYVPTRLSVMFAHHFSTIAGAGPIVGPTLAILYGFVPSFLWVILGGVFIGAVHDFTVLFASIREGGKSMAEISRKSMGKAGFLLFIAFTTIMIVLVTAVFLNLTTKALTSLWPLAKLGLEPGQTLLHTTIRDGVAMAQIGGIASTSVITITAFAPLFGYLLYRRRIHLGLAFVLASVICVASVYVGLLYPISIPPTVWSSILSVYVLFAAGVPVWYILQPRDFINTLILYGGMLLMAVSLIAGGWGGMSIHFPSFNLAEGIASLGLIWPMMFVTIACGAISGFHSLVASGTSAKQCADERHAKYIGYDGMLLECILALLVLLALGSAMDFQDYKRVVWNESNPVLGFSLAAGQLAHQGLGFIPVALGTVFGILMLEGFLVTTLDTAVRLNRYLLEELWGLLFTRPPAFMKHYWFNSTLCVVLMWLLAYTNTANRIWPIFGSSNQLLAALALLVLSTWLLNRGGSFPWFTLVPAAFMMATTLYSLVLLFPQYLKAESYLLLGADILLFILAVGVIWMAIRTHLWPRSAGKAVAAAAPPAG